VRAAEEEEETTKATVHAAEAGDRWPVEAERIAERRSIDLVFLVFFFIV
jgi:hypothetical protein